MKEPFRFAPVLAVTLLATSAVLAQAPGEPEDEPAPVADEAAALAENCGADLDCWQQVRATLVRQGEAAGFALFRRVWKEELRLTPPEKQDEVHRRISRDLLRISYLELWDDSAWTGALVHGYELTGNREERAAVEDEILMRHPCSGQAIRTAFARWEATNPPPRGSAETLAWNRLRLGLTGVLGRRCGQNLQVAGEHFRALAEIDETTTDELVAAGERYLAIWDERRQSGFVVLPSPYFRVAETFFRREEGLTGRLPALLVQAQADVDAYLANATSSPEVDEEALAARQTTAGIRSLRILALGIEVSFALGSDDEARAGIEELGRRREAAREAEGRLRDAAAFEYWRLAGRLAEREQRKLDAVAFYQNAHALRASGAVRDRIRALWSELGGGGAGFSALTGTGGQAHSFLPWAEKDETFAAFELPDLQGRTWRLADLAGKTVFVYVWATWCAPCQAELPYVQTLHEQLAGEAGGAAVVTWNADFAPGPAAAFVQEGGYTFPVLYAAETLEERFADVSIPRSWLLDGEGRLRREQVGFAVETIAEEWIAAVLAEIAALGP